MTQYTFTQLQDLWVQAGGNPQNKVMAAAIAEAESGGNSQSTNDNGGGSIDRGLWQINSGHGSLSTYDPLGNARAAVQLSNGGGNWRPWCTAYSDGLCGTKGGTYLGANSPFMKFLNGASTGPLTGGGTSSSQGNTQGASLLDPLGNLGSSLEQGIASAISDILAPIGRALMHTAFVIGGVLMMAYGIKLLLTGNAGIMTKRVDEPEPDVEKDDVEKESSSEKTSTTQIQKRSVKKAQSPIQEVAEKQGGRRRASSPSDKPAQNAPGRHRGQAAREGRTSKAATAKKAAETAAMT